MLSAQNRQRYLKNMAESRLNLLVIGGGITGAGIALDASIRGLKVGLVEKGDFASGTSSKSTKLIHGGLRYLKQGDVALVREVGRERAILYHNAKHLVIPEKMLLPIVDNGTYGRVTTSLGLWLYDRLAGVEKGERRRMLSRRQTLELEPMLNRAVVKGAGLYYEYRTDDARLTIEVMKSAHHHGATCVNYAQVTGLIHEDGKVVGAVVTDRLGGGLDGDTKYIIRADKIVNATGPWVDHLRSEDKSLRGKRLHLTKGVHIVVARDRLPIRQSIYFDVPDGRMMFAIPRGNCTYIGTTDTNYTGDIDEVSVSDEDVSYILNGSNAMFPNSRLAPADVVSSWAGVRPLIHQDGKSPSELSRKDEIFDSPSGLISIAGGKLTGYRKMAERTVDHVLCAMAREFDRPFVPCTTDHIVLSGGDFQDVESLVQQVRQDMHVQHAQPAQHTQQVAQAQQAHPSGPHHLAGISGQALTTLARRYGSNLPRVVEYMNEIDHHQPNANSAHMLEAAELLYGVREEMVTNPWDFLFRRTGRFYFDHTSVAESYPRLLETLAAELNWSDVQRHADEMYYRNISAHPSFL